MTKFSGHPLWMALFLIVNRKQRPYFVWYDYDNDDDDCGCGICGDIKDTYEIRRAFHKEKAAKKKQMIDSAKLTSKANMQLKTIQNLNERLGW